MKYRLPDGWTPTHVRRFSCVLKKLVKDGWKLERTRGSHFLFSHPDYLGLLCLQEDRNGDAKRYQIRQIRDAYKEIIINNSAEPLAA